MNITQTNELEVGVGLYGPIIERIGAPKLLTNFFSCQPNHGPLRCYSDNLIDYHLDPTESCDYSTLDVKNEENSSVNLYSNPVSSILNITTDHGVDLSFIVYDLSSKKVTGGNIINNRIDVSDLISGSYMLKIGSEKRGFKMSEFVKK